MLGRARWFLTLGLILAVGGPAFASREMLFEANEGQVDPAVRFLTRTQSYTLLLKKSNAVLLLKGAAAGAITMSFAGSNPNVVVSGLAASAAKINYFSGAESSWKRNIGTYQKVQYGSLYSGIDLGFYGSGGQLEYDFVLNPGADPNKILIALEGSAKLSIAANGDLLLASDAGDLRFRAPLAYQAPNIPIEAKFVLHGDHTVGLAVGAYDEGKTLIIDPVVAYSSFLGGSDDEGIFGIQRDRQGNIYLAGETSSLNFPSKNPVQAQEGGDYDAFVSKFDPSGTHLIYSTYLGGSSYDHAVGLAVDERGEVFVAGITQSSNFPVRNALQATLKGAQNLFAARLTESGSDLVFSTYLGGSHYDNAQDVTIDRERNIYIAGGTNSIDFPITAGAYQAVCDGANGFPGICIADAFVTKIAANGSKLLYSTFLGGAGYDSAAGIAVDRQGAAYITGQTNSSNFPVLDPYQSTLKAPGGNAFVSKLDPTGSKLEFSTYLGGTGGDAGNAIALGSDGKVYVAGWTSSVDFPTVKPFQTTNHGGFSDCFIAKFSVDGKTLLRSSYFGGSGWDYPFKLAVDGFGSVSVIGFTSSTDLPTVNAVQSKYAGGNTDAFVLKLLPESFSPLYSTYWGGSGDEFGYGIYSEEWGGVWVGGSTSSTTFPFVKGYQATYGGGPFDAFLTRITLTVPDYFAILRDLLGGRCAELTAAQRDYENMNTLAAIADLERLELEIGPQKGAEVLGASRYAQEAMKEGR